MPLPPNFITPPISSTKLSCLPLMATRSREGQPRLSPGPASLAPGWLPLADRAVTGRGQGLLQAGPEPTNQTLPLQLSLVRSFA